MFLRPVVSKYGTQKSRTTTQTTTVYSINVYIFTLLVAFTEFAWFYPVKLTSTKEVICKLDLQQTTFGNPTRIVSDSRTGESEFTEYCTKKVIEHLKITTGLPRGNGTMERIHRTMIPVLSKLSSDGEYKRYKYMPKLQRIIKITIK